jgi:hypothetical protein
MKVFLVSSDFKNCQVLGTEDKSFKTLDMLFPFRGERRISTWKKLNSVCPKTLHFLFQAAYLTNCDALFPHTINTPTGLRYAQL